jgi:outer membrane protease
MLLRVIAISGVLLGCAPALAQGVPATAAPPARMQYANVELEASIGVMQGEANEYVFRDNSVRLSQLVWAFDNDTVFNAGAAVRPLEWLALGIRAKTNITENSNMDDYDWLRPGEPLYDRCFNGFCHSWHGTNLTNYLSVDAYAAAKFYEASWIRLNALAGYKRDSARWESWGGYANHSVYERTLIINYQQAWEAPYLGFQFNSEWNRWTLQGRVIGSWWASGKDQDNHRTTSVLFSDHFGESNMVGANAHVGYRLTPNLMLKGEYDFQQWELSKGSAHSFNYETGARSATPYNGAGGDSLTQTISVGAVLAY